MKHQGRIMHVYEHIYIYIYIIYIYISESKPILDKITSDIIRWIWVYMGQFIESPIFLLSKCYLLGDFWDRISTRAWEVKPSFSSRPRVQRAGSRLGSRLEASHECRESKMSKFEIGKFGPKKMEESKFGVPTAQMSSFQLWGQLGFQLRGKRIISTKTIKTSEGALHLKICQPAVQPSPSLPGTNRRPACVKLRKLHRRSHNLLT